MSREAEPWFDNRFRRAGAEFSLYCFPFAGGSGSYYAPWAPYFDGAVELVPVQLPGRGPRLTEPCATSVAEIAGTVAALLAAAPTRTLLFGHSMGAILAFEVARRLAIRRPAEYLFVSGRPGPRITRPESPVSTLSRAEFVQVLRDYGAAAPEIVEHEELLDVLIPMMRADFSVIERYVYLAGPPLHCPVLGWSGEDDHEAGPVVMDRWRQETAAGFRLVVCSGGHFFLGDHVAEIAGEINRVAGTLAGNSPAAHGPVRP